MDNCENEKMEVEINEKEDNADDSLVTMVDVLQEQEAFEENANAVLGASDEKHCTFLNGYVKRQALYACLTCCPESKTDVSKHAGVCLACSLACHENHELIELYTKRNFRCDCGTPKLPSPCQFAPQKREVNKDNVYNQNFCGLYCECHRPYPDPEFPTNDEMIQCIICEDWWHSTHLDAKVPSNDQYSEMICKLCMKNNDFLHDYSIYSVRDKDVNDTDENIDVETSLNGTVVDDVETKLLDSATTDKEPLPTDHVLEPENIFPDEDLKDGTKYDKQINEEKITDVNGTMDAEETENEVTKDDDNVTSTEMDTDAETSKVADVSDLTSTETLETDESQISAEPKGKTEAATSDFVDNKNEGFISDLNPKVNADEKPEVVMKEESLLKKSSDDTGSDINNFSDSELASTDLELLPGESASKTDELSDELKKNKDEEKGMDLDVHPANNADETEHLECEKAKPTTTYSIEETSSLINSEEEKTNSEMEGMQAPKKYESEDSKIDNTEEESNSEDITTVHPTDQKTNDPQENNKSVNEMQDFLNVNEKTSEDFNNLDAGIENVSDAAEAELLNDDPPEVNEDNFEESDVGLVTDEIKVTTEEQPEVKEGKTEESSVDQVTHDMEVLNEGPPEVDENFEKIEEADVVTHDLKELDDERTEVKEDKIEESRVCQVTDEIKVLNKEQEDVKEDKIEESSVDRVTDDMEVDENKITVREESYSKKVDCIENKNALADLQNVDDTNIKNNITENMDIDKQDIEEASEALDESEGLKVVNDGENLTGNGSINEPSVVIKLEENIINSTSNDHPKLITENDIENEPTEIAENIQQTDKAGINTNDLIDIDGNKENEILTVVPKIDKCKRKLSESEDTCTKKLKLEGQKLDCSRPHNTGPRKKGSTFWPCTWRQRLCSCQECVSMYRLKDVLFLLDIEDTVTAYEDLGKDKNAPSHYEKGLEALSSLGHVQQINAITQYNNMKEKLLNFLKSFKDNKQVVKEEDIREFFAGMKPRQETDGVYFCR